MQPIQLNVIQTKAAFSKFITKKKKKSSSSEQKLLKRFQNLCRFIFISESFKYARLYYTTTTLTEIYAYTNAIRKSYSDTNYQKRVSTKKGKNK